MDAEFKLRPRVEVFDQVLIPTLARAEHDATRDQLDASEQAFIWDVLEEVLNRLESVEQFDLATAAATAAEDPATHGASTLTRAPVVGIAVETQSDSLVLEMLKQVLDASAFDLKVIENADSVLELAENISEHAPSMVIVSHLPDRRLRPSRYLVRRLRARFPDLEIVVGRWGETDSTNADSKVLTTLGASQVVSSLAELRDHILGVVPSTKNIETRTAPIPA